MTGQRETTRLEYECYESMALSKMETLAAQACKQWPVVKVSIVHRIGVVEIEAASIAVAVSSAHRAPAFEAASWLLERLKHEVPIWKRENLGRWPRGMGSSGKQRSSRRGRT